MRTPSAVRSRRRIAAQLTALASLQREISYADPNGRRKYLRDFSEAFRNYESVLHPAELEAELRQADVLLVGDYHALPSSQRFAAQVVSQVAHAGRPVVLGVETIFARDQHIVDEWMHGEIDDEELRERIRYDLDWGYAWEPFLELLHSARQHGLGVYGLDCMPRDDLRKIVARDRHAAAKIAEIRERHPQAAVVALFGESHLAPNHIPELLRSRLPQARILTVLQNVDNLYWRAAGERHEHVEAVRVERDVVCVFNATPLEKYESYRMCIERWRQERASMVDLAPTIYNLIGALSRFLNIDSYAPQNGTQPRYLVDMLPEVYCRGSEEAMRKLLSRKGAVNGELKQVMARLESHGNCYVPRMNALFVSDFQMAGVAEEAARFVHYACRGVGHGNGASGNDAEPSPEEIFYTVVLGQALGYFGSRVLYPARPATREADLYALYTLQREDVEEQTVFAYREYMQMVDFLVMHRDYEVNARQYSALPGLVADGIRAAGERFTFLTERLGNMLGSELYDAYVAGRVSKRYIRALFFRKLQGRGVARAVYFDAVRRVRTPRKRLLA
jgi:uncharacterized iron-regulated protein